MARGTSSRASSEFGSVRARAYPSIWAQKTKAAIDKNIRRDGESISGEKDKAASAVRVIAKILKNELPASTFSYTDVVEVPPDTVARLGVNYPFQIEAAFRAPGGGTDKRKIGFSFANKEDAEQFSQQLSEGMDLTDNGRPLDLRRMPDESEEQKDLDKRESSRRQTKEQKVFEKRENERNYAAFTQKVKDDMEAERKARVNE